MDELKYSSNRNTFRFIDAGKLNSSKVLDLSKGKNFPPNPKYNLLQESVFIQNCIDTINTL